MAKDQKEELMVTVVYESPEKEEALRRRLLPKIERSQDRLETLLQEADWLHSAFCSAKRYAKIPYYKRIKGLIRQMATERMVLRDLETRCPLEPLDCYAQAIRKGEVLTYKKWNVPLTPDVKDFFARSHDSCSRFVAAEIREHGLPTVILNLEALLRPDVPIQEQYMAMYSLVYFAREL